MFRVGLNRLVNHQSARGMASAKSLASGENVQKMKESLKKAAALAAVELRPPTPVEITQGIGQAIRMVKTRNWKNLTVREAWLNTLVATEVICWFFVGECIGKGTLIGYQV